MQMKLQSKPNSYLFWHHYKNSRILTVKRAVLSWKIQQVYLLAYVVPLNVFYTPFYLFNTHKLMAQKVLPSTLPTLMEVVNLIQVSCL